MKKLISVDCDITPFRPKTTQMKLFMKCGSKIFITEVSLRTKKKTFQTK